MCATIVEKVCERVSRAFAGTFQHMLEHIPPTRGLASLLTCICVFVCLDVCVRIGKHVGMLAFVFVFV
jgi:hypothetical protein